MNERGGILVSCILFGLLFSAVALHLAKISLALRERKIVAQEWEESLKQENLELIHFLEEAVWKDSTNWCTKFGSTSRVFCARTGLMNSAALRSSINYNSLFKTFNQCRAILPSLKKVKSNLLRTIKSCQISGKLDIQNIYRENLETNSNLEAASSAIVASVGYISLGGDVEVGLHTIILAGGNINIRSLTTHSSIPVSVGIYSAKGKISIESISQGVNVQMEDINGVQVVGSPEISAIMPPRVDADIVGFNRY